jgi:hypothetical protein
MIYTTIQSLGTSEAIQQSLPPDILPPIPVFRDKEDYRKWCVDPDTRHVFYSTFEGLNPTRRPSVHDNPPVIMHGFAADYDGAGIEPAKVLAKCLKMSHRIQPQWVTTTFSGKVRVIWEFEEPIQLPDEPKNQTKLIRAVAKELSAPMLAAGFDEASYKPVEMWEIGRHWAPVSSAPVPRDTILSACFAVLGKLIHESTDGDAVIPLEVVADALAAKFPSFRARWSGDFTLGSRGPLFWIDDGIERVGCLVTETGMRAFSTRAIKGLTTWADLLGHEFVKAYKQKQLADAAGSAYYEAGSGDYALYVSKVWQTYNKDNMLMRLKVGGISHRIKPGQTATDAEQVLMLIQETRRVAGAAPFMFNKSAVVDYNGVKFLNTAAQDVVLHPADRATKADFPWLALFFDHIFDDTPVRGNVARDYFFAWLQRFYLAALNGEPRLGQMMLIAGPPGQGKSFLSVRVMKSIFGLASDASNYLLEGKGFNKELGCVNLWNVDDSKSTATYSDHKRFSEMLKKHVASPELTYQPKYVDAVTLTWFGRICMTCNDDSDSLGIVPQLDGSILDKIMLIKCSTWRAKFGTLKENDEMLERELPYFLRWLVDWTAPIGVLDSTNPRYGVHSYHHPDLVEAARDSSPDHRFVEVLEAWRPEALRVSPPGVRVWTGSTTDLIMSINSDPSLASVMRSYTPVAVGRIMAKIRDYYTPLSKVVKTAGITRYHIDLKEPLGTPAV